MENSSATYSINMIELGSDNILTSIPCFDRASAVLLMQDLKYDHDKVYTQIVPEAR